MAIEFYQYNDELWFKTNDGRNQALSEHDTEIIQKLINSIREHYPSAYRALEAEYQKSLPNTSYYQYLIARRFCKCNFGKLESTAYDIESSGKFNFEKVECPLRGECKYEGVICCPRFNTKLSEAELRVMKLVYEGVSKDEISTRLFISQYTIKNHIKSVYLKLGIHDQIEFVRYANDNNLFNELKH